MKKKSNKIVYFVRKIQSKITNNMDKIERGKIFVKENLFGTKNQ